MVRDFCCSAVLAESMTCDAQKEVDGSGDGLDDRNGKPSSQTARGDGERAAPDDDGFDILGLDRGFHGGSESAFEDCWRGRQCDGVAGGQEDTGVAG